MESLGKSNGAKTSKNEHLIYCCPKCHYTCSKKYNLERHLLTSKHKILHNPISPPTSSNALNSKIYACECGKQYKHSSTLYAHKTNVHVSINIQNLLKKNL